ncbi:MAG: efflux RND transporter periplasmic adaptor subunit [Deltaproteobacteria bacterium]|nr:efflux RND transporter periplasmic adaptor subunit [Deltaproteobacteria bacterium]
MSAKPDNRDLNSDVTLPKKRRCPPIVKALFVLALLGLLVFVYWLIFLRPFETTDDAYVSGDQIRITPRVTGTILEILVDNTDDVAAGQLLVRLDPTDAALALETARENLSAAIRQVASLDSQRERLKALVAARQNELTLLKNEYLRRSKLKAGTSVTAEEVERYRLQSRVGESTLAAAQEELNVTLSLLGSSPLKEHPQIRAAATKLKEAWLALRRHEIYSPASGRVARRTAQIGAQVTAGTPLMIVTPLDDVWVDANFKESQLAAVKVGQQVKVAADLYGGEVVHLGVVAGRAAGTGSVFSLLPPENATGNWIKVVQRVPVRVYLEPEAIKAAPLLLGLSCQVSVLLNEPLKPLPPISDQNRTWALEEDFTAINQEIERAIAANLGLMSPESLKPSPGRDAQ